MRYVVTALLLWGSCAAAHAQTMTITGTVRNLDGVPITPLINFSVVAFQGNVEVARGGLVPGTPNTYSITIPATGKAVNAADVRVLLSFSATGRDPTSLDKIVGQAAVQVGTAVNPVDSRQTVDVVMPEATPCCYCPIAQDLCCHPWKRWHGLRHK